MIWFAVFDNCRPVKATDVSSVTIGQVAMYLGTSTAGEEQRPHHA